MTTRIVTDQIAAGLFQHKGSILLVRQQGPDDPTPAWALPGGRAEAGELLLEALSRESREETGLTNLKAGNLLYVVQYDDPYEQYRSTAFVFAVEGWTGTLNTTPTDPDGFVQEARFMPVAEAVAALAANPSRMMREPILAYLKGEVAPGAAWFYRRGPEGKEILVARIASQSDTPPEGHWSKP
jgi:8-oxo-dGTP diphosphatase